MSEVANAKKNGHLAGHANGDLRLHPSWESFIRFCEQLEHGEIERLKIQDGLPVLAEVTREKVKFV
jgi:hypothetical protein